MVCSRAIFSNLDLFFSMPFLHGCVVDEFKGRIHTRIVQGMTEKGLKGINVLTPSFGLCANCTSLKRTKPPIKRH